MNKTVQVQYTSLIFLLAVAVQQHKLYLDKERWRQSSTNEKDGPVQYTSCSCSAAQTSPTKEGWKHGVTNEHKVQYTSFVFLLAVAVQQHKLRLNKERWMNSATHEKEDTEHQFLSFPCL
jgi:hypothetical protein